MTGGAQDSGAVTLFREIDALGGEPMSSSACDRAYNDGYSEAIKHVLEVLAKRGFSEHAGAGCSSDKTVERLAYGYELMHRTICSMAGTSGADGRWYFERANEVFQRVSPVFDVTAASNPSKPGDCLGAYKTFLAARTTPAPAGWQGVDTAEIARLSIAGGLFEHVSGKYGIVWEGVEQPEEYQFRQRAIEKLGQFRADSILNMSPTAPAEGGV